MRRVLLMAVAAAAFVAAAMPSWAQSPGPSSAATETGTQTDPQPAQPRTPRAPDTSTSEPVVTTAPTSPPVERERHTHSVEPRQRTSGGGGTRDQVTTVPEAGRRIALTLDDGYNADPEVLDLLETWGIRGTAFLVGAVADSHPALVQRLVRLGWEICSHTYNHAVLTGLSESRVESEILSGARAVERASGQSCKYLRPPAGRADRRVESIAERLGFRLIGWDSSISDSTSPDTDPQVQIDLAFQYIRPGSILLGHFGGVNSRVVLGEVIRGLTAGAYRIGTVTELLEAGKNGSDDTEPEAPIVRVAGSRDRTVATTTTIVRAAAPVDRRPAATLVGAGALGLVVLSAGSHGARRRRYSGLRRLAKQIRLETAAARR